MVKTEDQIRAEIEAARAELASRGRIVGAPQTGESDESGIKCDFDLPYSTLPKLRSKKWVRSEKYT